MDSLVVAKASLCRRRRLLSRSRDVEDDEEDRGSICSAIVRTSDDAYPLVDVDRGVDVGGGLKGSLDSTSIASGHRRL